jgi:DNA-binding response OmpR family regulator
VVSVAVKRQHVLVMDDDPDICVLLQEILEEEGYHVTVATLPDWEPEAGSTQPPDLILLDLRFGAGAAGIAFLERLKASPRTATIPILICSADHALLKGMQDQLLAWGCVIVAKPFDLDALLAAVHYGIRGCRPSTAEESHDR